MLSPFPLEFNHSRVGMNKDTSCHWLDFLLESRIFICNIILIWFPAPLLLMITSSLIFTIFFSPMFEKLDRSIVLVQYLIGHLSGLVL